MNDGLVIDMFAGMTGEAGGGRRMTTREQRVFELQYSNDSRDEIIERLVDLEELTRDLWEICPDADKICAECPMHRLEDDSDGYWCDMEKRMESLGALRPMG